MFLGRWITAIGRRVNHSDRQLELFAWYWENRMKEVAMLIRRCLIGSALLMFLASPCNAKSQNENWVSDNPHELIIPPGGKLDVWFNVPKAILYREHALDLIKATIGSCTEAATAVKPSKKKVVRAQQVGNCPSGTTPGFPSKQDYFIIHVLRWNDKADGAAAQTIDKQNWYVFNIDPNWSEEDFSANKRVFGTRKVWLLHVQFNRKFEHSVAYNLKVSSKTPAYLTHLAQVGDLFGIEAAKAPSETGERGVRAPLYDKVWDATQFVANYVPSDMEFSGEVTAAGGGSSATPPVDISPQTFDNEGRYHIDFSVGVPIKKITELSYVSSTGTLTPAKVQKENLFALFNYHFKAFDIKSSGWSPYPHLVAGVAIGSRPLQKALIGVGYGPVLAHFYAGVLLNTSKVAPETKCGAAAASVPSGTALVNHTCAQFAFGLNIGVGAVLDTLKSKK
jgi:hypothetical protein